MRKLRHLRWLLAAVLLSGAFPGCRVWYETLSDGVSGPGQGGSASGAGTSTGGDLAQGASANAGDGNEPSGGDDSGSGGVDANDGGVDSGGTSSGAGGTGGAGGAGGSAGSAGGSAGSAGGSGGSGGSAGSAGSPAGDLLVTTNADESDAGATASAPGGSGLSLREAITIANATAGAQTITFQSGIVAAISNGLPIIADALTISGGEVNAAAAPNNRDCLLINAGPTTIDGLELYSCRGRPIYVTGGTDVHISNCNFHENSSALQVADTTGSGTIIADNIISGSDGHCLAIYNDDAQVIGNRVHDCGSGALFLSGTAANTRVVGNLLARGNIGISMAAGTTGTTIWHNTIVYNASSGINVGLASGNDLRNNILAFNTTYGVAAADIRFTQNDYNLYFGNGSGTCSPCMVGAASLLADPLFVAAASDDFQLQAASPAIDAGSALGVDRNGAAAGNHNGGAPDIGYWESP